MGPERGGGMKRIGGEQAVATLQKTVHPLVEQAKGLEVTDAATHWESEKLIKALTIGIRTVVKFFEPMRTATKLAARTVREQEAGILDPLKDAKDLQVQRCTRHEKRARDAAEAEQKRRDEAAAEDRRQLAESAAVDAAVDGDTVAADRILEEERVAPPPQTAFVEPDLAEPQQGMSSRIHWYGNVDSLPDLISWAAVDPANRAFYLQARQTAVNQWAKLPDESRPKIPGLSRDYKGSKRVTG